MCVCVYVCVRCPVGGRLAAGHADPADHPHHEPDLDPGGAGHEDGDLQMLRHRPGER